MRTGMHDEQHDGGKDSVDYEQHDHYMLQHADKDVSIHNLDMSIYKMDYRNV
jgi:hypothetical protein